MNRGWEEDPSRFQHLQSEWHSDNSATLENFRPGSNHRGQWTCALNAQHIWSTSIANRFLRGSNCPYCSGLQVSLENSLASNADHAHLLAEWHPENLLLPAGVSPGSNKKVLWICHKDSRHIWEAMVSQRVLGRGCPVCKGKKIIQGVNDLSSYAEYQQLITEWHPANTLQPTEVSIGSSKLVKWQCSVVSNHIWEAPVKSRTLKGNGCPGCSGHRTFRGSNDIFTTHPELEPLWHPTKNTSVTPEALSKGSITVVWWQCEQDHEWQAPVYSLVAGNRCQKCWQSAQCSSGEQQIYETFVAFGYFPKRNVRLPSLHNTELDLYLPQENFAVEYNGMYWHSEAAGKGKKYHQKKQQLCAKAGITLYQVWEDDWKTQPEIVIRGIAHRLGVTDQLYKVLPDLPEYYTQTIGARQTKITTLTYTQASKFLDENHIQGSAVGTHYLGLVDPQERLRAVLILKRTGKTGELSIERYATAGVVSGGFTKLLKHAEKAYEPSRWVTFADLSLSDGGLYEKTGFTAEKALPPDYSYLVRMRSGYWQRTHKFNYRLRRFREDPLLRYQDGLSERELALLNNLTRIWDSGKIKYVKSLLV